MRRLITLLEAVADDMVTGEREQDAERVGTVHGRSLKVYKEGVGARGGNGEGRKWGHEKGLELGRHVWESCDRASYAPPDANAGGSPPGEDGGVGSTEYKRAQAPRVCAGVATDVH